MRDRGVKIMMFKAASVMSTQGRVLHHVYRMWLQRDRLTTSFLPTPTHSSPLPSLSLERLAERQVVVLEFSAHVLLLHPPPQHVQEAGLPAT